MLNLLQLNNQNDDEPPLHIIPACRPGKPVEIKPVRMVAPRHHTRGGSRPGAGRKKGTCNGFGQIKNHFKRFRSSQDYNELIEHFRNSRQMSWINTATDSELIRWLTLQGMLHTTDPSNAELVQRIKNQILNI